MTRPDPTQREDSIRVLHVDDEANQLGFAKTFIELSDPTIHMESVTTPKEALERLMEESFDCIVSDYQMPGMDGIELAKRIRETSDIPIIIYTGRGSEEVAETAFTVGIDDYLRKEMNPSHYQVLAKRIRTAVEKHRAELALQSQLDEMQLIFDTMPATIWYKDTENRVLRINKAAAESMGLTVEEIEGRSAYELFPGEAEKYYQDDLEVIKSGEPKLGIVEELQPPSGERMWVRTDKVPIFDAKGNVTGLIAYVVDISESKRMEDELRAREEDLLRERDLIQVLFKQSPDFIYFKDSKARFHRASKRFTDFLGRSLEDILGKTDLELFPEEVAIQTHSEDLEVIRTGKPLINKEEYAAGTWVLTTKIPWTDNMGNIIGLFGISRDITERKRIEEERTESQERIIAIHQHSIAIAQANNLKEVAEKTFDVIEDIMGYKIGSFGQIDERNQRIIYVKGFEPVELYPIDGPGITNRAIRTGTTQRIADTRLDKDYISLTDESYPTLSELDVPVIVDGEVVALINLESEDVDAFTESDQHLVEILAQHVTSAIRGVNEKLARIEFEGKMETIHGGYDVFSRAETLDEIFGQTLTMCESILGFEYIGIAVIGEDAIEYTASIRASRPEDITLPLDESSVVARVHRTGIAERIADTREDPDYYVSPDLLEMGIPQRLSELAVPVILDGAVEAVIDIEALEQDAFTEFDQTLVEIIAKQVSGAIKSLREKKDLKRHENRLESLHRHASELASVESLEEIAQITLRVIEDVFGFHWSDFNVIKDDRLVPLLIQDEVLRSNMEMPLDGPGIIVRVYRTGEPQLVHDTRLDDDYVIGRDMGGEEWLSELAVPVKKGDEVVAVINIEDKKLGAFTLDDQKLIEIFAEHVASAIDRIDRLSALRTSEDKFRTLLEESRDAVFVLDQERYLYANVKAAELLGIGDPSEVVGRSAFEFIAPEVREKVREIAIKRQKGEEVPNRYEFNLVNKEGTRIPVETNVSLIEYDGKPASLAINRDITERKQLEEASRQYREKVEALHTHASHLSKIDDVDEIAGVTSQILDNLFGLNVASVGFVEDGRLIFVSQIGAHSLTELPLDGPGITVRAVNSGLSQLVHDTEKDGDTVHGDPTKVRRMRSELSVPIIVDGEAIGVLDLCRPQPDQFSQRDQRLLETLAQHVASAVVRVKQLSEQRTFERQLELLHTHVFDLSDSSTLEEISNKTQEAIVRLFDPQRTVFALVDDEVLKPVTVYGPNAPVGMPLDGPGITIRAILTGVSQRVNDTRLDADYVSGVQSGDPESRSEMDVPLIIDGEVVGLIGIESTVVDAFTLQDQKLVEILAKHVSSAMSRLREVETLVKLVERRSQELVEAEKMSAAGKVAAMVGHDLRGPLQTIKNSLYLMENDPDSTEEMHETIGEAVDYAASMLEELRLNIGDSTLQLQEANLETLIRKAVEEASIPDSVAAEVHVDDGLDSVSMDPLKIRRVLDNLVRNAVEAMLDGGTLKVSAEVDDVGVEIRVRDTGTGVRDELMPDLFKAFVTTKPKGMGLGLPYCRRAVEAHGGTITVESEVGVGSTFTVRLPLNR